MGETTKSTTKKPCKNNLILVYCSANDENILLWLSFKTSEPTNLQIFG